MDESVRNVNLFSLSFDCTWQISRPIALVAIGVSSAVREFLVLHYGHCPKKLKNHQKTTRGALRTD